MRSAEVFRAMSWNCLVVEDSHVMRQLLSFALNRIPGLNIVEADDGLDGMKKLAAGRFDIVIVDINMPIMDGLKMIRRIRSDRVHSNVPIMVITTEGSNEDQQRAAQLGVQAYIPKPVHAHQVIAKVKELLPSAS